MTNPQVYIYTIGSRYNTDLFPVHINKNDIISMTEYEYTKNRYMISQYTLEVKIHKLMNNYKYLTDSIDSCEIIYIPIYTFLLAWNRSYVYNVSTIVEYLNSLKEFIDHYSKMKKILIVYSDVMWDDNRCFINYFSFNKNVFFVCYETTPTNLNRQIPVPYVTHIQCDPNNYSIPPYSQKTNLICYCGRYRKEQEYIKTLIILDLMKYQEVDNQWISYNNSQMYDEIDNLYLNSTFSLQPHGDRETRKGFYHSILLGCIPVIFENNSNMYKNVFSGYINIEDICIIIKPSELYIIDTILKNIDTNRIRTILLQYNKLKTLLLYYEKNIDILNNIFDKITRNKDE